ncbi:MAG: ATP-dependent Clp protease, protease subunit [Patescibacteria group bacterium]|nr:ATP-dependent Clp protease, protease subunit [Patescibacteria group bacterium]
MEKFIIFEGHIDQQATQRLVNAINNLTIQQPTSSKITIFFSSLGGSIYEGFLLATIIQNSRIPIAIHATNHIDSIANVIYLSAKERTAESHAKFYLHGAATQGNFDEKSLKEQLSSIKTNNSRIAYFVSENSKLTFKRVQSMMENGTTISAQDALKSKIVNQIIHKEIPVNAIREEIIYVN